MNNYSRKCLKYVRKPPHGAASPLLTWETIFRLGLKFLLNPPPLCTQVFFKYTDTSVFSFSNIFLLTEFSFAILYFWMKEFWCYQNVEGTLRPTMRSPLRPRVTLYVTFLTGTANWVILVNVFDDEDRLLQPFEVLESAATVTWPLCFVSIFSWSYDSLIAKGWATYLTVKDSKKRKGSLLPGLSIIGRRKTFLSISGAFPGFMTYVTHVIGGGCCCCVRHHSSSLMPDIRHTSGSHM